MRAFDLLLILLLPSLILFHLVLAPYTKVEESFNLQATHDILLYGTPEGARLQATFDHFEFPGAVPRTFFGAVILAGVSRPVVDVLGWQHAQLVVRAVLGLFNAFTLLRYADGVRKAFGATAARWWIALLLGQFHVLFYASRTLPNMFAFGLSTMALRELLPIPSTSNAAKKTKRRHRVAIYLLVLSGVIFRSELALLLFTHLAFLLLSGSTSLRTVIPSGLVSALIALTLSVPLDSYFWQRTLWPELAGFIYNAIEGKSSDWGTSPFHAYFTNFLPKLLLNPLVSLVLIPLSIYLPSSRRAATAILVPILAFIAIYSIQPHKEARFIIYVVPPLTTCAAVAASYVTTHRSRSAIYRLLYPLLILSILGSFAISTLMLGISSLNYPGGEAIARLQDIVLADDSSTKQIAVHIDVLSCMTGITRFQQEYPSPPLLSSLVTSILSSISPTSSSPENYYPKEVHFDKTEDEEALLLPSFWSQFEYVLTSTPETVIGKWIHVETVRGYSGIEILKPGMASASDKGREEKVYDDSSAEIKDGEAARGERTERPFSVSRLLEVVEEEGLYNAVRKVGRRFTGGWWVGPRMEEKIWILKRERGDYLHT